MPSLNIYTIYMIAIAVLLCVIEFVLVRMEKNDLAIGLPILVLTESFVSGLNLALLSLILFLIMIVTKRIQFLLRHLKDCDKIIRRNRIFFVYH